MPIDPKRLAAKQDNVTPEVEPIIRQTLEFTETEYARFMDLILAADEELTPGDAIIYGHYKAARVRAKLTDAAAKEVSRG
tara:strand:+ start:253 stop:492 length:240 start_codon:yes stop_codon:yes gene_type:complete